MNIKNVLSSDSHWRVNKHLSYIFGDLRASILLTDLIDCYVYYRSINQLVEYKSDLYFYKTSDDIQENTTLSYKEQKTCIAILEKHDVIKTKLMGTPAKLHFTINENKIWTLLNSSFDKKLKLVLPKGENFIYNNNNNKENNIYTSGEEKKEKTTQYTPEALIEEEKEKNCVQKEKENKDDLRCLKKEDDESHQKKIIIDKMEEKEVKTKLHNPFDFDKIFKDYNRGNYETAYRLYHKTLSDLEKEKMYKHVYEYIELAPLEFRVNIEKYIKTKMFNDSLDHLKKSKKEEIKEKELTSEVNKLNIKTDLDEVWEMYEELEKKKQKK